MQSSVKLDGNKVTVKTGYMTTVFRDGDSISAAKQIAILHERIIDLTVQVRELRQRSIRDGI